MELQAVTTSFGKYFGQITWVVPDIQATENHFRTILGISHFVRLENLQSEDLEGTYRGKTDNHVFHLSMAYSGESVIELIQPVSGPSIFREYLDKHPQGGVQHVAFIVPDSQLEEAISEFKDKGYSKVQSLTLPFARVAYFDTSKELGVMTEIIGVTEAGIDFVEQLRSESA
ncbi:VOC family protein [Telluribacter humicola]|uniref:VOC family protein n=1 Tax=Telluribacter humicola TaxID=1720261 RepID=UPI001A96CA7D|nr:VOC family protein [Telluribacter humicola]